MEDVDVVVIGAGFGGMSAALSAAQHGARVGHAVEDVYWTLALQIEEAVMRGTPLYGFSLDSSKCFDYIPCSN